MIKLDIAATKTVKSSDGAEHTIDMNKFRRGNYTELLFRVFKLDFKANAGQTPDMDLGVLSSLAITIYDEVVIGVDGYVYEIDTPISTLPDWHRYIPQTAKMEVCMPLLTSITGNSKN